MLQIRFVRVVIHGFRRINARAIGEHWQPLGQWLSDGPIGGPSAEAQPSGQLETWV